MGDVLDTLRQQEHTSEWLALLEDLPEPAGAISLPRPDQMEADLRRLGLPAEDIDILRELQPELADSPDLMWLFRRCVHVLSTGMGSLDTPPRFSMLPESLGSLTRYFYVYVFLAMLPEARAYHQAQRIPDDVSWATFTDLGRHMTRHRRSFGIGGLDVPFWFMLHFRGCIYELGRLQFDRGRLGQTTGKNLAATGQPFGPGDLSLGVHIPELSGPMSPEACDASFARAREFFPRHFPDEDYKIATCHSWLLDPQLAEYLPPTSNIVRFQRRFRLSHLSEPAPGDILYFVFGHRNPNLDELPQDTTLERAVVAHLKAGRDWHIGAGWLEL